MLKLTVAGAIETFDKTSFRAKLAMLAGVDPGSILLRVWSASVHVEATIYTANATAATSLAAQLDSATPQQLSSDLGVTVRSIDSVSAPAASSDKLKVHRHHVAAPVVILALLGVAALGAAIFCWLRASQRRSKRALLEARGDEPPVSMAVSYRGYGKSQSSLALAKRDLHDI